MGFIRNRLKSTNKKGDIFNYGINSSDFLNNLLNNEHIKDGNLGESTFLICLKFLSECMGKLPIIATQKDNVAGKDTINNFRLDYILNVEPNENMTATNFWETVEFNRNFYGNAYVYNQMQGGNTIGLWILPSDQVEILCDQMGIFGVKNSIWYRWTDSRTAKQWLFSSDEILHYKSSISWDGYTGVCLPDLIQYQIDSKKYSQEYLGELYKNKMMGNKVIVQYDAETYDKEKATKIANQMQKFSNNTENAGKWIPIPMGFSTKSIDMKLTDAQYQELSKMSSLELAAVFGIKPNILNNYDHSSYSNSETQQLDFYINSLMPILKGYDQEDTRKLLVSSEKNNGIRLERDTDELFKMSPDTLMTYVSKGVQSFLITPNEGREKLGYAHKDGGDELLGNGAMIKIDQIGTQWVKNNSNINQSNNEGK